MKLRCIVLSATIVVALFAVMMGSVAGEEEVVLSNQDDNSQMQPVSEPPIKLVHVLNPGEREYLSPNLIGVQNIAMTFLPLSMNFINIIDAFREIVNGVRYEILLNAVDTKSNDADVICRLVILEKPWLRTEWGDKVRELQHSNCTREEEENLNDPMAKNRALNDKYVGNAIFNGGTRNELSNDEMAKLDAQIMPLNSNGGRASIPKATTTTTTTTTTERNVAAQEEEFVKVSHKDDDVRKTTPANTNKNVFVGGAVGDDTDDDEASTTEPSELTDNEKRWLDDFLSVSALNFENSRQTTNNNYNAYNNDNNNQNAENDGNYVRVQKATFNEQQQYDESQDHYQQEQGQQVEPDTEQYEPTHVRAKRSYNTLVGGPSTLDEEEAKTVVQKYLQKFAAGENGPNYSVGETKCTKQVVAGSLIKCGVVLSDENEKSQRCNMEIWSQPWLPNGDQVTIDCPGQESVKGRFSRSVEYAEKKSLKKLNYHNYDKTEHLFNKFQRKYNKQYHTTMEYSTRLRIFRENIKIIQDLNRNEMGSAKYGLTQFADLTSSEYKEYTGLWQRDADKPTGHELAKIPDIELPKEFDWREKGVISQVKNQGNCGSCWAFSVTGNIEGLHAVKTGKLEEYSEQELLDCDSIDSACSGGLPDNAYKAIQSIGGLELESDYPYKQHKEQCNFDKAKVHVKVTGAIDLPKNETAMALWLMENGPISIGINANAMQFYRGGISHPISVLCPKDNLDHGVLIVGFGVSEYPLFNKILPYWIVKNSWGKQWGEQGFYRVYRGDNTCGVTEMASSAVIE